MSAQDFEETYVPVASEDKFDSSERQVIFTVTKFFKEISRFMIDEAKEVDDCKRIYVFFFRERCREVKSNRFEKEQTNIFFHPCAIVLEDSKKELKVFDINEFRDEYGEDAALKFSLTAKKRVINPNHAVNVLQIEGSVSEYEGHKFHDSRILKDPKQIKFMNRLVEKYFEDSTMFKFRADESDEDVDDRFDKLDC